MTYISCSHRLMLLRLLVQSFPPLLPLDSDLVAFQLLNRCFILLLHRHIRFSELTGEYIAESK